MNEITPGAGWWKATDGEWYPPRWEYNSLTFTAKTADEQRAMIAALDRVGQEGWEAIGITDRSATSLQLTVLLKRQLR